MVEKIKDNKEETLEKICLEVDSLIVKDKEIDPYKIVEDYKQIDSPKTIQFISDYAELRKDYDNKLDDINGEGKGEIGGWSAIWSGGWSGWLASFADPDMYVVPIGASIGAGVEIFNSYTKRGMNTGNIWWCAAGGMMAVNMFLPDSCELIGEYVGAGLGATMGFLNEYRVSGKKLKKANKEMEADLNLAKHDYEVAKKEMIDNVINY